MLRLFKIEINKLWESRAFRVLIGIYVVTYSLFLMVVRTIYNKMEIQGVEDALNLSYNPFKFPDVWIITTFMAQYFTILAAIIIIVLVVNEFTFRTARQHVIDGLTRAELVLGKFITVVMVSLIITVLVFLLGSFAGLMNNGGSSITPHSVAFEYFFAFFFRMLGMMSFAMFLAMWIRRTGVSILLFIVIHYGFIATIFRNIKDTEGFGEILPIGVFARLLRGMPFPKLFNENFLENISELGLTDYIYIAPTSQFILALIYIGAFMGLSYLVIKNNDLK